MGEPMPCPRCKKTMNFHALREREPRDAEEVRRAERLGGRILEEFHSCANCHITVPRLP